VQINDKSFVFRLPKGHCYDNQFWGQIGKITIHDLLSFHWHSEVDWRIKMPMDVLMVVVIPPHLIEICWALVQ